MTDSDSTGWVRASACIAGFLLLVSCGGGSGVVGSGGTGTMPNDVVVGTVNGFGSVIVDGLRLDDRNTPAVAETEPGKDVLTEVRLGDRVEASFAQGGVATSLRVEATVVGPLTGINGPGRFVVMGQTVLVNDDPAAGPVTQLGGYQLVSDVQAGDVVEVHGLLIPQGVAWAIQTTRIERTSALPAYVKVTGAVSELRVAGASQFRLGALAVDASTATVLPSGLSPANGQIVSVLGQATALRADSGGALSLVASQIRIRSLPADAAQTYVSGQMAGLDTAARTFLLGALKVDYAAATLTPATTMLSNGLYVRVLGATRADGTLAATGVMVRDGRSEAEAELTGTITGFSATTQTLTIRDVNVDVSHAKLDGCPASGLADGLFAEVHGSLSNTTVIADELHCEDEPVGGTVEREGTAGTVDPTAQTFVLTQASKTQIVRWSADTFFRGVTPTTLNGAKVSVEGVLSNGELKASKVKLGD